jgi:hypothetical protein
METNETPTAIQMREQEVAQYQTNIDTYTAIAANLPSEWPEHLVHLKDSKNRHTDIATVEDLDEVILVGDLWTHDDAVAAIRTETIEMRKSLAILSVLQLQAQAD